MASHVQRRPAVLVVDNHPGVREALALLLEANGLGVFAQASTRAEAMTQVAVGHPDLALVDLSLGDDDSLALVDELHKRDIPVVVCSSHEEPGHVRQALDNGARAYVAKRDAGRVLIRTLRDVLEGWVLISPRAADGLPDAYARADSCLVTVDVQKVDGE